MTKLILNFVISRLHLVSGIHNLVVRQLSDTHGWTACHSDEMYVGGPNDECVICPTTCPSICGVPDPVDPICQPNCLMVPICQCRYGFARTLGQECFPRSSCP